MNSITHSIALFFFLLCNSSPSHSSETSTATDELALLHFKSLLTDPTKSLSSWNSSLHFCQWRGINCSIDGRVTRLELISLQLAGPISPSIGNLTFLESLKLSDNDLIGPIPAEIGRLSRLVNLTLKLNYLSGEIPASIVRCSDLQFLHLRSNLLTGEIPRELGLLTKLQVGSALIKENVRMSSTRMLNVSIRSLSCFEQEGMIWIWPGDEPPTATLPCLQPPLECKMVLSTIGILKPGKLEGQTTIQC